MELIRAAGIIVFIFTVFCYGVAGLRPRNDHCGVCDDDSEACRIIAGIYTRRTLEYGYNQISRIPAGACNINVTELARSRNHLVLKYSTGSGVINSDKTMLNRPGLYAAAGTSFSYGKQAGIHCPGDCFFATGPINTDMDIQLLTYGRNPGIRYIFMVPKHLVDSVYKSLLPADSRKRHEGRNHGDFQSPGSSVTTIKYNTAVDEFRAMNREIHFARKPTHDTQPQYMSSENRRNSSTGYQALESGPRGIYQGYENQNKGSLRRNYASVYQSNLVTSDTSGGSLPRRTGSDSPPGAHINYVPHAGYQGPLYSSETQEQRYGGERAGDSSNRNINDLNQGKSQLSVPNTIDEINFRWTISGFTECSATCAGGRQDTKVVCTKGNTNMIVTEENCDPAKKNIQSIICNKQPCPPDWEADPWSVCSKTCGEGLQTRKVECQQRYSQNYSIPVTASLCDLEAKPETSRSCLVKPCAEWRSGNWSKCSVECGIGQTSRTVECVNTENEVVSEQECSGVKPLSTRSCDMGSCSQGWFLTTWSKECSVDCGKGYRYRIVYCSAEDGSPLPESRCGRKPRTKRKCKGTRPCGGFWFTGPWSQCSATCGTAVQTRDVVCMKRLKRGAYSAVKEVNCVEQTKPESEKSCPEQTECPPEWFVTNWSQCSESCGGGFKTRDVKCLDVNKTSNAQCSVEDKPSLRRTCKTQDCNLPQLDEDPECKDVVTQCQYVVQAGMCQYDYYQRHCCHSCTLHNLKHKQQREQKQQSRDL